ncbi:MAG TPA: DinB family protein [Rhodoblastus sp.]|nr:DinB family protein [Rhodoblastus sp.]
MIDPAYAKIFARYNRWQNESLFTAAAPLTDAQRREDRGAFFKSVHATLNHLLWADAMWMSRLADVARPATPFPGLDDVADWDVLTRRRVELDERIIGWADGLRAGDLDGDLVWVSGLMGGAVRRPRWIAVAHMFNHQTHHRGQVHALLTGLGARPQDTDLILSTFLTSAA